MRCAKLVRLIDFTGTDRITKTTRDVFNQSGAPVSRTTTQVWATDNADTPTTVSITTQDGYGNLSTQTEGNAKGVRAFYVIFRFE